MSKNSPSARKHRALRFLAHLEQYKRLGPLIGPKEAHQPDHQWRSAETCSHPPTVQRIDVFRTAVSRDHPGYSETRRVTCEVCGYVRSEA